MDNFDYNKVFSSIDYQGRYSYRNQPNIILWNLTRFAETILPLIDNNLNKSIKKAEEILNEFASIYESNWISIMGYKLGIDEANKTDKNLIEEFLTLMQNQQLDFTNSFYSLSFLNSLKKKSLFCFQLELHIFSSPNLLSQKLLLLLQHDFRE